VAEATAAGKNAGPASGTLTSPLLLSPQVIAVSVVDDDYLRQRLLGREWLYLLAEVDPEARLFHHVRVESVADLVDLVGRLTPPPGPWANVSAASLPSDLDSVSPPKRKELFVGALLPLVAFQNDLILEQRRRLEGLAGRAPLSPEDRDFLAATCEYYRIDRCARPLPALADTLRALLDRVDEIPASLVIAQAAIESGWGAAYASQRTNNLFGEQAGSPFEVDGTEPAARRFRLAVFPTIGSSVGSYMRNLNSHPAYEGFRWRRRLQRHRLAGQLDPLILADGLGRYSERGRAYVEELVRFIQANDLQRYDVASAGQPADLPT
jgi:Bax protein